MFSCRYFNLEKEIIELIIENKDAFVYLLGQKIFTIFNHKPIYPKIMHCGRNYGRTKTYNQGGKGDNFPPPYKRIIENQENSGIVGENEKIIRVNFITKCVKFIKIRTNFRRRDHLHTLLAFVSVFQNLIHQGI
jgi:hypothetical protein